MNMPTSTYRKSAIASAVSTALLLSLSSTQAFAAEEDEVKGKMERIEVTANRRTQNIQEVPYNISAVSGEDLENANIIDASEMMRGIAGITVVDRGYRNSGTFGGVVIRGVNVDGGGNGDVVSSSVATVATYVDDTPIFANFLLTDVEMVEVLRGPQGTLYGSGSMAGTVRYRMNKPDTDDFYGSATLGFGQTEGSNGFNMYGNFMINVPLSDRLAFRGSLSTINNDGIIDYTNVYKLDENNYAPVATDGDIATGAPVFTSVEDADTVDITNFRGSLLFKATDDLTFQLSYQQQSDEIGGRRQVTRGTHWTNGTGNGSANRIEKQYGDYENGAIQLEPSDRDVDLTSLEITWDLGFATLTSSSSLYNNEGNSISDNTGFYAKQGWFQDLYYGSPRPMAQAKRGYTDEAFVQEIRLVSNKRKNNIDWIVGAYYMDQDTAATQDSYMPGYIEWGNAAQPVSWWNDLGGFGMVYTDNDFHYVRKQNFIDKALFGELTYHFSDDLRATFGFRTFQNEFVNDTVLSLPIWPFLGAEPHFETNDSDTLFKGNISYDINDDTMIYSTISEGYRRGGANAVPLDGPLAERPEWQQYNSDSAINYELGVKGYLDGGAHSYTASIFKIDWSDPQLNTASTWGFFTVANGDSAVTQGLELELQGYLSDELHYVLGYAYIQAELSADFLVPSSVGATDPTRIQAEDGAKLPASPEHTMSVAIDYTQTLENGMYWVSTASAYYQSSSVNNLGDGILQADIDGFSILNVGTSLIADDWSITLYAKNIFNEDGVTGLLTEAYMGTEPAQNFYGNSSKDYISQPRTIGMAFRYLF